MPTNLFRNGFLRLSLLLGLMSSSISFAAPIQIHNTGQYHFQSNIVAFTGQHPRLYLLKNHSPYRIVVNRKIQKNPGVSAGWASRLSPGKWSALMLNQQPFILNCTIIHKNQHYQKTNCKQVLTIKTIKHFRAQSASIIKNNYWVAENWSYRELIKNIRRRGILF